MMIKSLNLKSEKGIYQLINLVNGKTYIGSSLNLKRRLKEYLNPLYITRNLHKGNSAILKALLKYGFYRMSSIRRRLQVCPDTIC